MLNTCQTSLINIPNITRVSTLQDKSPPLPKFLCQHRTLPLRLNWVKHSSQRYRTSSPSTLILFHTQDLHWFFEPQRSMSKHSDSDELQWDLLSRSYALPLPLQGSLSSRPPRHSESVFAFTFISSLTGWVIRNGVDQGFSPMQVQWTVVR